MCIFSVEAEKPLVGQRLYVSVEVDSLVLLGREFVSQGEGSSLGEEQAEINVTGPPDWVLVSVEQQ